MLMINLAGILLIALIVWWFWLYQPKETSVGSEGVQVLVTQGVYEPSHIRLPSGKAAQLTFIRKDPGPCAEMVIFPDLDISEQLPVGVEKAVQLPPLAPGKYSFHCQMQMYQGQVHVE